METHKAVGQRHGRILVVNDDPEVRKVLVHHLTRAGYEVVETTDGEEGIRAIKSDDNPFMVDTIICDMNMPKINGKGAVAYFRSQCPAVPVVVLTGYPDTDLAVAFMKQGVRDYLIKPVTKDTLLTAIRHAVDQHICSI